MSISLSSVLQRGKGEKLDGVTNTEVAQQESQSDTGGGLSESEIFDLLRNSRRRAVLSHLIQEGEGVAISELTERVATEEYGVTREELSSDQYKRVYTGLYQCHLPRLAKHDVIDFDKDEKLVTLRDEGAKVGSYLGQSGSSTAARLELAVAVAVALAVTLGVFSVGPFGTVPVTSWALLTVLTLFGFGLFGLYE
jgi:hypothetical protein